MKARLLTALVTGSLLLSGCGVVNFITPYKLDIPQGNEITADQVENLRVGMTRSQVKFVLGTPLLVDPMHANRWDYSLRNRQSGNLVESKTFTVFFEGNSVVRWEGDYLATPEYRKANKTTASAPQSELMKAKVNPGDENSKSIEVKPLIDKEF